MAGSLNKVQLIGNLGADPEIKSLQSGSKVANFRIATSESWRDKQSGEKKEKTEWHSIVVWNENLVKIVEQYIKKGDKVYVEGVLRTRKWDKNGVDHYSTEIVLENFNGTITMLSSKNGGEQSNAGRETQDRRDREQMTRQDLDDEIPFK